MIFLYFFGGIFFGAFGLALAFSVVRDKDETIMHKKIKIARNTIEGLNNEIERLKTELKNGGNK